MTSNHDWEREVFNYSRKSAAHDQRVRDARAQIFDSGDPVPPEHYWETVYTLAQQREQMQGADDR